MQTFSWWSSQSRIPSNKLDLRTVSSSSDVFAKRDLLQRLVPVPCRGPCCFLTFHSRDAWAVGRTHLCAQFAEARRRLFPRVALSRLRFLSFLGLDVHFTAASLGLIDINLAFCWSGDYASCGDIELRSVPRTLYGATY